jgi:hypothetical protein
MRKQFDRAAAEAFACLTPIQSACYHYMTDNFSEHHKITLRNYFMPVLLLQGIKPKYVERVVITALVELTYPVPTNGDKYTWSGCQRAAYAGISQSTWSDKSYAKALILSLIQCVQMQTQQAVRYNYK